MEIRFPLMSRISFVSQGDNVPSLELDATAGLDSAGRLNEAEDRQGVTDFPQPDSPTIPTVSRADIEESIDRRAHRSRYRTRFGDPGLKEAEPSSSHDRRSYASRSASPRTLSVITVKTMKRPGKSDIHQSVATWSAPS